MTDTPLILPANADWRWRNALQSTPPETPDHKFFKLALEIYDKLPWVRAELEARILANQPPGGIGLSLYISTEVVDCYEFWFFDVRPYLQHQEWISQRVVCLCSPDQSRADQVRAYWRWCGYYKNLFDLQQLITSVGPKSLERSGLEAYLLVRPPLPLWMKLEIAAELVPQLKSNELPRLLRQLARLPDWKARLKSAKINSSVVIRVVRLLAAGIRQEERREQAAIRKRRAQRARWADTEFIDL